MSFWSTLGKIALPVGAIAAAPFSGGSSLLTMLGMGAKTAGLIGAGLGTAGAVAGGMSKQRAEDRGAQADYDAMRVPIQNSQSLQYAQAKRQAEADRLRQIGGAEMLQGFKAPTDPRAQKYTNNGQLMGGQISPETLAMMRDRSMNALNSGSDVPQMQAMPAKPGGGATGMDSFLNALSMGGTTLGVLRESGLLNGDGGRSSSVNAPADLASSIFKKKPEDDVPAWSPLARRVY